MKGLLRYARAAFQFVPMVKPVRLLRSWRACTGYTPLEVTLWLTYRCNACCAFCPIATEEVGWDALAADELSTEQILRVLDDLAALGTRRIMVTGGEPTLRKDLMDIIVYATQHKIRAGIFTNGGFLNASRVEGLVSAGIDTICISVDAADTALHDSLRNAPGLGEKALAALGCVDEVRKRLGRRVKLVTNTVVTARNYRQLDRIVDLKADIDFDHATFATLVEYEKVSAPELHMTAEDKAVLDQEIVPRLREKAQRYGLPVSVLAGEKPRVIYRDTFCFSPWLYAEILPNGKVVLCDRSTAAGFRFGNVKQTSFREIWDSEKLRAFRRACRPPQHKMCQDCTMRIDRNLKLMRLYRLVPSFIRPYLEGK